MITCKHCQREIELVDGRWIDPEATGDDSVWRETCDSHDTFEAEHEPDEQDDYDPVADLIADGAEVIAESRHVNTVDLLGE